MSTENPSLRDGILKALAILNDRSLGERQRLTLAEHYLVAALVEEAAPAGELAERILARPGVAEAIARVQREGGDGVYYEANEDGTPSNRPMRVP